MALGPGSIAFVGFNADGNDNLAFVVLHDIVAGELITFEDNEWNGTGWIDTAENAFIWTATSTVTAGTVVILNNVGADPLVLLPSASTGTVVYGDGPTYGTNPGIGNSNETIYAYIGSHAAPTFITAVTTDAAVGNGSLANTGLTYGVNALDLGQRLLDGDIFAWKGARAGYSDFAALRTALNATPTAANWDAQDGSGDQSADGTPPDVPFSSTGFTTVASETQSVEFAAGSLTVSQAEGNSGTTEFVFTVERTGGTTGDVDFSGTFTAPATDNADYTGGTEPISFSGTILDGQASGTVTIQVAGDVVLEVQ